MTLFGSWFEEIIKRKKINDELYNNQKYLIFRYDKILKFNF